MAETPVTTFRIAAIWAIVFLLVGSLGYLFSSVQDHQVRITVVETRLELAVELLKSIDRKLENR